MHAHCSAAFAPRRPRHQACVFLGDTGPVHRPPPPETQSGLSVRTIAVRGRQCQPLGPAADRPARQGRRHRRTRTWPAGQPPSQNKRTATDEQRRRRRLPCADFWKAGTRPPNLRYLAAASPAAPPESPAPSAAAPSAAAPSTAAPPPPPPPGKDAQERAAPFIARTAACEGQTAPPASRAAAPSTGHSRSCWRRD